MSLAFLILMDERKAGQHVPSRELSDISDFTPKGRLRPASWKLRMMSGSLIVHLCRLNNSHSKRCGANVPVQTSVLENALSLALRKRILSDT